MPSFVLAFPFTIQSYLHSQLQTIASDSYSNDIALLAIQHQSLGSCSVISYNIKWKRKCMQLVIACCVQLYVSFMKRYIAMYIIIVIYIYIFNPTYTTSYRLVTRTAMALYCQLFSCHLLYSTCYGIYIQHFHHTSPLCVCMCSCMCVHACMCGYP